jgi:hypothetical protein
MIVVGGMAEQFTFPETLGGLAPIDCGNEITNNLGFVLTGDWRSTIGLQPAEGVPFGQHPTDAIEVIARTIAHEAAHTFGLQHIGTEGNIMHPNAIRYQDWECRHPTGHGQECSSPFG